MKHLARSSLGFLFVVLALFAGCVPSSPVTITNPTSGTEYQAPPEIELAYQTKPSTVTLNATSITRFFTFGATSGTANTAEFESFLRQGSNRVQVGGASGPFVDFIYNSEGPKVVIETVEGRDPVRIAGYLDDPSGPQSLSVNGVGVSLVDGRFDTTVAEAPSYQFIASDTSGLISETTYVAPSTSFSRIITTRVSEQAMTFIADEITPLLTDIDLSSILPDVNREIEEALQEDLTLIAVFADVEVTDIAWLGVNAALDIKPNTQRGVIGFDADVYDLVADVDVHTILGLTIPVTAKIAYANATGDAQAYGNAGKLALDLVNLNLHTQDLIINLAGYDTVIISALANLLMPALEGVVSTFVNGIMEEIIDQKLQEIGDEVIVDINGYQMGMTPLFQGFSSDHDSLHVVIGGGIMAKTVDLGVPQVLGSLYTTDVLPNATTTGSQIYANVSTNFINQALMASFQTGLNHFAFIDKNELQIGTTRDDEVGVNGTERILIDPASPAFMQIDDVLGDPVITFNLNAMGLRYQKKYSSGYRDLFETKMDVEARVLLGVNEDDTLRIEFAGSPDVTLKDTLIFDTIAINQTLIKNVIKLVMPVILPEIAKATQSIEIPKVAGYQLTVDDFSAVGTQHKHLGAGITITNENNVVCAVDQDKYAGKCYEKCAEGYTAVGASCWVPPRKTYGRGVGAVPAMNCGSRELDAGLCYDYCDAGYDGVGPVCWTTTQISYGRGVGTPMVGSCPNGMEQDAGLCYNVCRSGFHGVGPVCWNDLPQSYGRGAGTIPNFNPYACPAGKEMQDGLCYVPCSPDYHGVGPVCWLDEGSYGRGVGIAMNFGCPAGQEEDAGLCYPQCELGYNGIGPVCWSTKLTSYGRGVGTIPAQQCGANEELDGGLCYEQCDAGYNGIGPVCWPSGDRAPYTREPVTL